MRACVPVSVSRAPSLAATRKVTKFAKLSMIVVKPTRPQARLTHGHLLSHTACTPAAPRAQYRKAPSLVGSSDLQRIRRLESLEGHLDENVEKYLRLL